MKKIIWNGKELEGMESERNGMKLGCSYGGVTETKIYKFYTSIRKYLS